jgi:hypothetical protein
MQLAMWCGTTNILMDTWNYSTGTRPPLIFNPSGGRVGIGITTPGMTLHVSGNLDGGLNLTNTVSNKTFTIGPDSGGACIIYGAGGIGVYIANGGTTWNPNASDARSKTNIITISDALSRIQQLRPVTFNYIADAPDTITRSGFIAQEVDAVFPKESTWITLLNKGQERIDDNGQTYNPLTVSTTEMIPYIIRRKYFT